MPKSHLQLSRVVGVSATVGACVGFVAAVFVLLVGYRLNEWLVIGLCPTSMSGMALSYHSGIIAWGTFFAVTLLGNAVWYSFLFGLAGIFLHKRAQG